MKTPITIIFAVMFLVAGSLNTWSASEQVIAEAEVRRVLTDFILKKTENLGLEINLKKIGYNGDMLLPQGAVDYEVVAPRQWEGWGNTSLALIVRVDGRVKKNLQVRVEVEALSDMVVTKRRLEQGQIIGEADVAVQKRDLSQSGAKICKKIDEVLGKRLKSTVTGNTALRADQLERVPIIKSGQLVNIVLENDVIRITATGRSKGAAAAGETIMVQNLTSLKDIPARVVDASTVRVEF